MSQTVDGDERAAPAPGAGAEVLTFDSLDPRTGEVVGQHRIFDEAAVRDTVGRARQAAAWWAGLGFAERKRRLLAWRSRLARRIDELAGLISAETGKPLDDARLECVLVVAHLDWAARHAERVLGRRRVRSGLLMAQEASTLEYQPHGVVGVIGPWNYPAHTPMGSIGYALAAGNAVVFKPSELTPGVGRALATGLAEVAGEHPVLQVVTGFGETGAALCRAGVDKLAFTGSTATAKQVMATCADSLTPVVIECGGKDALLVDADADLDAAAAAAVWGGM
ncbi:MAG TPA: aldehyde dehydrogenase family protein, partial [Pseudonocardiaceae bacterium]|nr:aldehyde dehydrogenase family protein [Pseudonocardiaceae bacterium]